MCLSAAGREDLRGGRGELSVMLSVSGAGSDKRGCYLSPASHTNAGRKRLLCSSPPPMIEHGAGVLSCRTCTGYCSTAAICRLYLGDDRGSTDGADTVEKGGLRDAAVG